GTRCSSIPVSDGSMRLRLPDAAKSEELYRRLPIPLQHLTCTLQGLRLRRLRYNGEFRELLRQAEARTYWDAEAIGRYRDARLREYVRHCAHHVPHYRELFRNTGFSP